MGPVVARHRLSSTTPAQCQSPCTRARVRSYKTSFKNNYETVPLIRNRTARRFDARVCEIGTRGGSTNVRGELFRSGGGRSTGQGVSREGSQMSDLLWSRSRANADPRLSASPLRNDRS